MKFLSTFILFIFISMINCDSYDLESLEDNFLNPIYCEMDCSDKLDSSNADLLFNSFEYLNDFEVHNYIEPINKFCNELNSNLLDYINKIEDISEKFKTSFNQRTNNVSRSIDELRQKMVLIFNESNYLIKNTEKIVIGSSGQTLKYDRLIKILSQLDQFKLIKTIDNEEKELIYEEPQNCKVNIVNPFFATLDIQLKVIKIKSDLIEEKFYLNKITTEKSVNIVYLNYRKVINSFVVKTVCDNRSLFFDLSNTDEDNYCYH